jgi:hypothetical protein
MADLCPECHKDNWCECGACDNCVCGHGEEHCERMVASIRAQLSLATAEIAALRLQVESRDRTILGLLATLAETEERLPGITAMAKLKETR